MRLLFTPIICIFLFWNCSNGCNHNVVYEQHKEMFDSFLTQFAQFDGKQLDASFFRMRKQFPHEKWCPEINKYLYSSYLPNDDLCVLENGFCYRPCYRIERNNFYIVSINKENYSYDDNTLVTYDKKGEIIDVEVVGVSDNGEAYKIEPSASGYEVLYTQYSFQDVESAYDGYCDVSVYKVTVDDNGRIDKKLLREEKSVKVNLYNVY